VSKAADRSFWLREALKRESGWNDVLPLAEKIRCDVCIVGGGYTGLWTALELKQRDPTIHVVLLEADVCGSGASGTNAGYLMDLWPKYTSIAAVAGEEAAALLAKQSADAVSEIVAVIENNDWDVGLRKNGWLWTSSNPAHDRSWEPLLERLRDIPGSPFLPVDADEASQLAGTPVRGGVVDPTCSVLQPALLARALRRLAIDRGVVVYENTPMTGLTGTGMVTVRTSRGEVRAATVVLAINAWAMKFRQVRRHMVITASDNIVTEPLDWPAGNTPTGVGVSDSGRLLNYWRTTIDGRLLFGKGGLALGWRARAADTFFSGSINDDVLKSRIESVFPQLAYRPAFRWRAPVEYSTTSLPFFTPWRSHPRVFIGTGYSGDGVGPSKLGAKILASLALMSVDEWSSSPLTHPPPRALPPDPLRFVGGQVVRRALLRQDSNEALGQSTGRLTRALTRLDATAWIE